MKHNYANFGRRFLAVLIDAVLLGFMGGVLGALMSKDGTNTAQTLGAIIGLGYQIYFIGKKGQTLGKMAMGIKVVLEGTQNAPGYGKAILREVVGKFISGIALSLGYLWMLWDPKKQAWHDKIAGTIVVRV